MFSKEKKYRISGKWFCLGGLALLILLGGCEAPLMLDGVEQERKKVTRRSDLMQSVADNGKTIVVVGNMGLILVSVDRGHIWKRRLLEDKPFLMDVTACPNGDFVALDYLRKIWIGDAEGLDWQSVPIDSDETPQAVTCDAKGRIWIVGGFSTILRSDDSGVSWTRNSLQEDIYLTAIYFVDAQHAYIVGEFGVVMRSENGGESWESLNPLPDEFYPQDAYFRDTRNGWVVGLNGTILFTANGGLSWSRQTTDTPAPLYGISERNGRLFVVGGNGTVLTLANSNGDDDQATWVRIEHDLPIRFYLRAVLPIDDQTLLIAGGAGALFRVSI